ncbi:hypothetical protein PMIN01_13372 [Paraphaeosphaeria minitans]|uniref:Uncharacterized protein n=1 Tax=Paraphaeosphaeria minitans TaxID=565426 RepID=A0A9P6KJM2_9PLEO|nr:hypothetical protein PMIN01_13372 [Paraphaeosphaeria minitans]
MTNGFSPIFEEPASRASNGTRSKSTGLIRLAYVMIREFTSGRMPERR